MNTLILKNFGGVPEITPDANELKRKAIEAALPIKKVDTPEEQTVAVAALRELKSIRTGMESTRKAVKAPVLTLGKKIDEIAYEFLRETDREENRLQGLINHYQRKILNEQREKEKELERAAATVEDLRADAEKTSDPIRKAAMLDRASELEESACISTQLAVTPEKTRGLVVRQRLDFKVTDAHVCAQAYPQFWKPMNNDKHENEILKLDRQTVLEELNREDRKGIFYRSHFPEELPENERALVKPPGMNVFEDVKSHVR